MLVIVVTFTLVPRWMVFRLFSYSLEDRIELTGYNDEFAQKVQEAVKRRARLGAGKGVVETFSDAEETSMEETTAAAVAAYQSSIGID